MSDVLERLRGVTNREQAEIILSRISDREILGGDFVGDDFKKRVRELIKKYHPDIPDENLVPEIKTLITQRINSITSSGADKSTARQTKSKAEGGEQKNRNDGFTARDNIQLRVLSISMQYRRSNKTYEDCKLVLEALLKAEKDYKADLKYYKADFVKGFAKRYYDFLMKSGTHDCQLIIEQLEEIEKLFQMDLKFEKDKILEVAKNNQRPQWKKGLDVFKHSSNGEYLSAVRKIVAQFRDSNYKSLYSQEIGKLSDIEEKYWVDLTKEKKEILKLYVHEIMVWFRNEVHKDIRFDNTISKLQQIESDYGMDFTKEKNEVIKLYVHEIMTQFRNQMHKDIHFDTTILKLQQVEKNYRANLSKEKDEVVRLNNKK